MLLCTDKVRIIPFETVHSACVYKWFHSGEYDKFFLNQGLLAFEDIPKAKMNTLVLVNPINLDEVFGIFTMTAVEERHRNLNVGLLVDKLYHGTGIAFDGLKLGLYNVFNNMNFYKAKCCPLESNLASIKLAEKVGFRKEGKLENEFYMDGEFHDAVLLGLTKGPFNKRYKAELEKR